MGIGFGKFDSVGAIWYYRAMLDGSSSDSISFGEGEWAERFDGPLVESDLVSLIGKDWFAQTLDEMSHGGHYGIAADNASSEEYDSHSELISDALEELATCAGFILTGDSQGFVYGESFNTPTDLEREWERLRKVEADLYRDAMREEHSEFVRYGDRVNHPSDELGDWCEDCAPVEGFDIGDTVNFAGIASRVVGYDDGDLIIVMIGDDNRRTIHTDNLEKVEDYCASCGQVGCYGDGRPVEGSDDD